MGDSKKWTTEETEYLQNQIGTLTYAAIARNLNRTETAVIVKSKRLKTGCYKRNTDRITVADVAEILNIDRSTVYSLLRHGKITCVKKNIRGKTYQYFFDIDEIMSFAEKYEKQNYKPWTPQEVSKLKFLRYEKGLTVNAVAKELDRSSRAVEHKIAEVR